jgi:hypothetical protein
MTTGRINQVNINSSFVPRIPEDASTSKKTMQAETCIVFLQEIFEMQAKCKRKPFDNSIAIHMPTYFLYRNCFPE